MMNADKRVLVHNDKQQLADAVGAKFVAKVSELLAAQPLVHVVLTGGSVGIAVLASINAAPNRDAIDWARLVVWWGDERWVPSGHADRNEGQAHEALLDHVAVLPENVHVMAASDSGIDLDAAAEKYASELSSAADGALAPQFDIMLLGVGPDGHVASLFPDYLGIQVTDKSVVAVRDSPKPPPDRISLTLPVINGSARVWLVLAGADKASALGLALAGASPLEVPVAGVGGKYRTTFFVDQEAAAEVPEELIAADY